MAIFRDATPSKVFNDRPTAYGRSVPKSSARHLVGIEPFDRSSTPPPYSGPASTSSVNIPNRQPQPKGPQKYPGLPLLDYRLYSPPLFELSSDKTSIKTSAPYLSANATALVSLIRSLATVPPKPQVHITGKRGRRVDFAVKLNLMSLLVPEDPKQRMDYLRCVGEGEVAFRGGAKPSADPDVGEGGVEAWARRFVEDPAGVKSFMLERVVANLDINWLEGQIRSAVAALNYKGHVNVAFPVTHSSVVVQNPGKLTSFFTTLFSGKNRYEVVKAVWPFATHRNGEPGRKCVVQSEETWWREWRDPIRYAISQKRQGYITNEDKLEAIMEGAGKGVAAVDWGPEV
ncbi:hypothetical protein GQ53DRAFT_782873 [Thozetella sp. PMI_491]|nr:hypothetical protein GQ53DRAFT_782873 [Thozetella sp. PMI_491]